MNALSVDCDCDGHAKAPCMKDMIEIILQFF